MNVAIIGFGSRGQYYAKLFKERGVKIVAICDKNDEKLEIARKNCRRIKRRGGVQNKSQSGGMVSVI